MRETSERSPMASASHPNDLSLRRNHSSPTARPSKTNAAEVTNWRAWMRLLKETSGGAEALDARDLACQYFDHLGIPLRSGSRAQYGHRCIGGEPRPVRPVVHQGIECIAYRNNSSESRNLPPAKTVRIAAAVVTLVVMPDDRKNARRGLQRPHGCLADPHMLSHARGLDLVERAGLEQDRVGHADLSDVVDDSASIEGVERVLSQSDPTSEVASRLSDSLGVPFCECVLRFNRGGEREDHLLGAVERVVERLQAQSRAHPSGELRSLH